MKTRSRFVAGAHPSRYLLGAATVLALQASGCALPQGDDTGLEDVAESSEALTRPKVKTRFTWSIKRASNGKYAPKVTWNTPASYSQVMQGQEVPVSLPGMKITDLGAQGTRIEYPQMSDAYVEDIFATSMAAWASVVDVQFMRTNSEKADLIFSLPENATGTGPEEGGLAGGNTVYANMRILMPGNHAPFWSVGDHIPALVYEGMYDNQFLRLVMHEVGHFLFANGNVHAFDDTARYGRDANGNPRLCNGAPCPYPGSDDDLSIMDYHIGDKPVLLSEYDIVTMREKYPASRVQPLIELWSQPTNEHFYTRSWPEANHLLRSTWNQGTRFKRLVGGFYAKNTPTALRTGFNRYYDPAYNGHSYALATTSPQPNGTFEDLMGFVAKSNANSSAFDLLKAVNPLSELRTYRVDATGDERFFRADEAIPLGHTFTGVTFGYLVKRNYLNRNGAFDDGGYYKLVNRTSNKVVEINANSMSNGGAVVQRSWSYGQNQQFSFVGTGDGHYAIVARSSGGVLDVAGNATNDGAAIHQWTSGAGANQEWRLEDVGGGYYRIRVRSTNKCLDNSGASTAEGNKFVQWNCTDNNPAQQFQLQKVDQDTSAGAYLLTNQTSGKAIEVGGGSSNDGAAVQQWTVHQLDHQKWIFSSNRLMAKHSSKYIDAPGPSPTNGTQLRQMPWSSTGFQEWTLKGLGDGYFNLIEKRTGKCLDTPGASTADGARLQLWTCNNNGAQKFKLSRLE